jgi:hypothetical protein
MSAGQPNLFAYCALLAWPIVALFLYSRLPIGKATLWTILGGYLLLPADLDIKFAHVPAFNKESIPNLAALICCSLYRGRLPSLVRGFGAAEILLVGLVVSPFITSMLNSDPIQIGETYLPGVGPYDALSATVAQFIDILPFFLARQCLRGSKDNAEIFRTLVIAGLAYSLPMLFEVRMSPQLNTWIYGYLPSDFVQEMRDGGFRPVVFLGHGLGVAFFSMTTVVAAATLWRTGSRVSRFAPGLITSYLSFVLLLCKTASVLIYGALLFPLVRWASARGQLRVACVLIGVALIYPILRVADVVPTTSILEVASDVSVQRAGSLQTRFDNEDQLLAKAWERKWFGWGRFGRNRVYNGWMGADTSVTDGYWIIILGEFGLFGFAVTFGLLTFPVFRAAAALKYARSKAEAGYIGALGLIVAINVFDSLPNAPITPWTWLLVGALLGRSEALRARAYQRAPIPNLQASPLLVPERNGLATWSPSAGHERGAARHGTDGSL